MTRIRLRPLTRRATGLTLIWLGSFTLVCIQGWLIAAALAPHTTIVVPQQRPAPAYAPHSQPGTPPRAPHPAVTHIYPA